MRPNATWLLVGAVLAIGVVAGADALRGGGEAAPPPAVSSTAEAEAPPDEPRESTADRAVRQLREAGVAGTLTFADERCTIRSLALPDLEPQPGRPERSCRFTVSAGAVSFGPQASDAGLFRTAACRRGAVDVRTSDGQLLARHPGCSPVWRPGGRLTLLRDGDVVELSGPVVGRRYARERELLSRSQLERALVRAGWTAERFVLREFAWLRGGRIAVVVRAYSPDETLDLLAVFSRGRLVSPPRFGYERLQGVRSSPAGSFAAARILFPGGLAVVDAAGRPVPLAMRHGDAIAWSRDERWIAEATDDGVYVFAAGDRSPRFIRLPVAARDLAWE
ncbi:MAG TPA: hypothetical protein VD704_11230 [Gaiellaceae bacterium]|nr:hypothetical protein [Gaiellaceae bacterium]